MAAAILALIGVVIGTSGTLLVEYVRGRSMSRETRRDSLRTAAAEFVAGVAQTVILSAHLAGATDQRSRALVVEQLQDQQRENRAMYEAVRLVLEDHDTQRAGRLAIRHANAVWKQIETGADPRGAEYLDPPIVRYNGELRAFLIGVRRQLGVRLADNVFEEPD